MTDSFVYVHPAQEQNRVKVRTEKVGDVELPAYVQTDGDGNLISDSNPLPVTSDEDNPLAVEAALAQEAKVQQERMVDLLFDIVQQQKLTNLYLQSIASDHFTKDDIED